jgi:hypothetical protein
LGVEEGGAGRRLGEEGDELVAGGVVGVAEGEDEVVVAGVEVLGALGFGLAAGGAGAVGDEEGEDLAERGVEVAAVGGAEGREGDRRGDLEEDGAGHGGRWRRVDPGASPEQLHGGAMVADGDWDGGCVPTMARR